MDSRHDKVGREVIELATAFETPRRYIERCLPTHVVDDVTGSTRVDGVVGSILVNGVMAFF